MVVEKNTTQSEGDGPNCGPRRETLSPVLPTDCYQKPFSCQITRTLFIHCPAQPLSDIFYCGPALPCRRPFPWPLAPLLCELPSAPRTLFLGLHCLLLWIPSCLFLILYASWWEVRSSWTIIGMKRKRLNVEITWRGFQLTQVKPGGKKLPPSSLPLGQHGKPLLRTLQHSWTTAPGHSPNLRSLACGFICLSFLLDCDVLECRRSLVPPQSLTHSRYPVTEQIKG